MFYCVCGNIWATTIDKNFSTFISLHRVKDGKENYLKITYNRSVRAVSKCLC